MKSRKPWREKMNRPAKVVDIPAAMQKANGSRKMLIPCPLDVDALIRTVRRGRLVTQSQIRETLARAQGADVRLPDYDGHLRAHRRGGRGAGLARGQKARNALLARGAR